MMLATAGGAASAMRSASWARSSREVVSGVEASTTRTLVGRRCKNSSRSRALSAISALSPSSCFIRRNNCEGFLSPSSSDVKSCWSRRCSDAAVRLTSCSRR